MEIEKDRKRLGRDRKIEKLKNKIVMIAPCFQSRIKPRRMVVARVRRDRGW